MLNISEFDDVIHHIEQKAYNSAIVLLKAMKHDAEEEEPKSSNKKDAITAFEAWISIYEENYPDRNDSALTCREREMWLFGYNTANKYKNEE